MEVAITKTQAARFLGMLGKNVAKNFTKAERKRRAKRMREFNLARAKKIV